MFKYKESWVEGLINMEIYITATENLPSSLAERCGLTFGEYERTPIMCV